MNRRVRKKVARRNWQKLVAWIMTTKMGVNIKPSRIRVKETVYEDRIVITGNGCGYTMTFNFIEKGEKEDAETGNSKH